jgi:hypothetical protein
LLSEAPAIITPTFPHRALSTLPLSQAVAAFSGSKNIKATTGIRNITRNTSSMAIGTILTSSLTILHSIRVLGEWGIGVNSHMTDHNIIMSS